MMSLIAQMIGRSRSPGRSRHPNDLAGSCCPIMRLGGKVQPEQFERRARLVSAIVKGRQWLDDVVSGRVTTVQEICIREKCSVRHVNMTISLAFLAPNLVKAAVQGRLPRGIGVERLRDPPAEWSQQFEDLGLNPGTARCSRLSGRNPSPNGPTAPSCATSLISS